MTYIILVYYIFTKDITYLSFAAIARRSIPVEKPPAFCSDLLPNFLGGIHDHFPCTAHQGTHQSMLADPAIRNLPGRLGPEERCLEYPAGRGRGDCDAAHEILKTNIYHTY